MERQIWLDMDGNFVDLYGVEGWLDDIHSENPRAFIIARPLVNMSSLARVLNHLAREGYGINIVSWCARGVSHEYDLAVANAKREWLARHLPSVRFDRIEILPYGVAKSSVGSGYLFDDEEHNRNEWMNAGSVAYSNEELLERLRELAR